MTEQMRGAGDPLAVRDGLTTLIAGSIFDLALEKEIQRALRYRHALVVLLFDVDDLSRINREQGRGVGDRLLERLGILARAFFRTHDWVARYGGDAIAVLLPEATVDQAADLALGFRDMVQHRLVLQDHNTGGGFATTVSGAVVGTDRVHSGIRATTVMAEAEAAVLRARLDGVNRIERVQLP